MDETSSLKRSWTKDSAIPTRFARDLRFFAALGNFYAALVIHDFESESKRRGTLACVFRRKSNSKSTCFVIKFITKQGFED